jgi:hypothetical protein
VEAISGRAERVTHDTATSDMVRRMLRHRLDSWGQRRRTLPTGRLGYVDEAGVTGLLHDPNESRWDVWSAPLSLREVEPQVLLQLGALDPSLANPPEWVYWDDDGQATAQRPGPDEAGVAP